ncbi:NAD(P)-binding domain-containing protein [Planotetraspora mira]|nr:NAD(P)-binding domain-containing protein [Planotetraspora mira]
MIAFLGLGRMGALMAGRLVDAGHKVTVWNRTRKELPGAQTASSPAEAVADADLVVTMLSDPAAVDEVARAALPGLRPGTVFVEMSTIGPEAVARLRDLLPESVRLVDAPVLGSLQPAAAGTLAVLAGGAPEDLARVRDVLTIFGTIREAGPLGAGAALKLAVMSASVSAQVMLAENLAYAEALELDRSVFLDTLSGTALAALVERLRPAIESGPPATGYSLGLAAKDLRLATEGPGAVQTVTSSARDRLAQAAGAGLGGQDITAIFTAPLEGPSPEAAAPAVLKINPPAVPATNGYYSHATRTGDLLFVSGQVALDEKGEVVGEGDMARQSEFILGNLERILEDQGSSFDRVLHVRTFLTDMSLLREYGDVRSRYFTGEPPASTTVEVSRLFQPGLLIEVEVVAAAG